MWMVDPKIMCRQHLLGEHLECHMFISSISIGKRVTGFLRNNLLEPASIKSRHDILAAEMNRREYKHNSPLSENQYYKAVTKLSLADRAVYIDNIKSLAVLRSRCNECGLRYRKRK